MKTRLRGILQAALLAGWAAFLLLRPQQAAQAVAEGLALWLCQLTSAVLLGVLLRGSAPRPQCAAAKQAGARPLPFSAAFTRAVKTAGSVSLSVCMIVVTFRVLCGALDTVLPAETPVILRIFLSGVLELSGGTALLAQAALPRVSAFALCSFFLAFGGVGVAAQVASVMQDAGLRVHGYLRAKLLQGVLAAILSLPAGLFLFADRQNAARLAALYAAAGTICFIFRKVMAGNLRAKRV